MSHLKNALILLAGLVVGWLGSYALFNPPGSGPTVEQREQFADRYRELERRLKFESRLRQATSATIASWSHPTPLVVNDPADLQKLQLALRIKSTRSDIQGGDDRPTIHFHLADGTTFECSFDTRTILGSADGQAILEDGALLDLVNALVSKKEGRPVDLLKDK